MGNPDGYTAVGVLAVFVVEVMVEGSSYPPGRTGLPRRHPLALRGKDVNAIFRWVTYVRRAWVGYLAVRAAIWQTRTRWLARCPRGWKASRCSLFLLMAAGWSGWRSDAPKGLGG